MKIVEERLATWKTRFNILVIPIGLVCLICFTGMVWGTNSSLKFLSAVSFSLLLGMLVVTYILGLGTKAINSTIYYVFPLVSLVFSFISLFLTTEFLNDLVSDSVAVSSVDSEPIISQMALSITLIVVWIFLFFFLPYQYQKYVLYDQPNQKVKDDFEYQLERLKKEFPRAQEEFNKTRNDIQHSLESGSPPLTPELLKRFAERWQPVEQLIEELLKQSRYQSQAPRLPFDVLVNWAAPALGILGNLIIAWLQSTVLGP